MCAANEGFINIVEKLLKFKGIDVNSSNVDRYTSLMCAADKGFEKIVKLLLAHPNIDINLKVNINLNYFSLSSSNFSAGLRR